MGVVGVMRGVAIFSMTLFGGFYPVSGQEPVRLDSIPGPDSISVRNGDGISDGECDCAGNVDDVCGECGGTATSEDECGPPEVTDGCDLPSNNLYLYGGDVLYNSAAEIGGFQFNVDGATVLSAQGGDAEAHRRVPGRRTQPGRHLLDPPVCSSLPGCR